jgi:hypothetical protein
VPLPSGTASPYLPSVDIRRAVVLASVLSLFIAPPTADAQYTVGKVHRIGILSPAFQGLGIEVFREGLRALGYVEGHNIVIEYRSAEGRFDRMPELAAELVAPLVGETQQAGKIPRLCASSRSIRGRSSPTDSGRFFRACATSATWMSGPSSSITCRPRVVASGYRPSAPSA